MAFLSLSNWVKRVSATSNDLFAVVFAEGIFVAVGQKIVISTDGTAWTQGPEVAPLRAITFGNGRFVAAGPNGVSASSTNGLS